MDLPLFIGTVINRKDKKGRVSVPASFRAELAGQSFAGVVVFPAFRHKALECCGRDYMQQVGRSLYKVDAFSEEQDDYATTVFARAATLPFDSEGRIMLPPELMAYARLTEQVAFVGQGPRFQLWQPGLLDIYLDEAAERARHRKTGLKVQPPGEPGEAAGDPP